VRDTALAIGSETMIRLLALDLDGTLVKKDGSYDPRDLAAIADARARGVEVLIATGRLIGGTAPVARDLGLTAPMVCADGATLATPQGELLDEETIDRHLGASLIAAMEVGGLHPFVFDHHRVHATEAGEPVAFHTRAWSPDVQYYERLLDMPVITMLLGLGTEEPVAAVRAAIEREHGDAIDVLHFGFRTGTWAVRIVKRGVSKGSAVMKVAASRGLARGETACVGDWYNDIPMFDAVGRSFVMAGAPTEVQAHASDALAAVTGDGGGIAEAIGKLVAEGV
jgi:Cof subfamily protein (haloacid dehalogenase superfamily)